MKSVPVPANTKACVLLSGGLDSTAALHWARRAGYAEVRALGFRYGQPHAHAELARAGAVCARLGVPFTTLHLADAMNPRMGLLKGVADHDPTKFGGLSSAFVPGRNVVFLAVAAGHAAAWWPGGNKALIFGACAEDSAGFPDCRQTVVDMAGPLLRYATATEVRIEAPFLLTWKASILRHFASDPEALTDLRQSWSCYRGESSGPCGTCQACTLRAAAFRDAGLEDASLYTAEHGGDPSREKS